MRPTIILPPFFMVGTICAAIVESQSFGYILYHRRWVRGEHRKVFLKSLKEIWVDEHGLMAGLMLAKIERTTARMDETRPRNCLIHSKTDLEVGLQPSQQMGVYCILVFFFVMTLEFPSIKGLGENAQDMWCFKAFHMAETEPMYCF